MFTPVSKGAATDPLGVTEPQSKTERRASTRLQFSVATTIHDVLRAWRLVYDAYRRIDLIDVNAHRIHTNSYAASPSAAVVFGELGDQVETTLTAIHDSDAGLPLDSVYRKELDALRKDGRQLSEIGLFADRRESIGRSVGALLDLIRLAFYYTLRSDDTTVIIGVHPHHIGFYKRLFGFELLGDVRPYEAANGKPVALLQLPIRDRLKESPTPRGLLYFVERPVDADEFRSRYRFPPDALDTLPLAPFRTAHAQTLAAPA